MDLKGLIGGHVETRTHVDIALDTDSPHDHQGSSGSIGAFDGVGQDDISGDANTPCHCQSTRGGRGCGHRPRILEENRPRRTIHLKCLIGGHIETRAHVDIAGDSYTPRDDQRSSRSIGAYCGIGEDEVSGDADAAHKIGGTLRRSGPRGRQRCFDDQWFGQCGGTVDFDVSTDKHVFADASTPFHHQ